ncbi:MAG: pirin family protein [Magnetococcales bacterium]|nr:pirin family protein [Magnetococcales bacterium]
MITLRRSAERGAFNHGWLDTRHTFSFADYDDPAHRGFRSLRVINEDIILPGTGFDTHAHRDMEIITYPITGSLAHRDSTGSMSIIRPGQVQHMTAGRGIRHSEHNASTTETCHFMQIWITPDQKNLEPGYDQKEFPLETQLGRLCLIASPDGADHSLQIHQDVRLYALRLNETREVLLPLNTDRHAWVQVIQGHVTINGLPLQSGDGASLSQESSLRMSNRTPSELLLFDLA